VKHSQRFAPYVAFVLSGLSSLIFQTIWTRMLHHVFGATSVAISTVLAAFMAGLGFGTWIAGKYAARIRHPIFAYASAEVGVAIWGLLIPFLVASDGWLADVNAWLRQSLGAESATFMIARFICVVPILLVPTTLMGTSLPLLAQHFARNEKDPQRVSALVGTLYAVNTVGAALGPFLSAFVLMPTIGLSLTNLVACSLNLLLGGLICAFRETLIGSKWGSGVRIEILPAKAPITDVDPVAAPAPEPPKPSSAESPPPRARKKGHKSAAPRSAEPSAPAYAQAPADELWVPPIARKMALIAFALSGASALCYEVVWSRALAMTIGSSIYSFAIILDTFLIGIAGGSAAMAALMGRARSQLAGIAITAGVLTMLSVFPFAIEMRRNGDRVHHGDFITWALVAALPIVLIGLVFLHALRTAAETRALSAHAPGGVALGARAGGALPEDYTRWALVMLLVPLTCAVLTAAFFSTGYLPKILASVVACICALLAIAVALRKHPVLLLALVQLFIAGATTVSYVWQDEIPYAFAQLVVSLDNLPDHVGTVQFFMFLTSALCMLPATLGMGAMFPLTVRIWTAGGPGVARDVAVIYTGNTVGAIAGSWLTGFVLIPVIGMERTLHVGIALNMLLALGMLIAGAAEPEGEAPTASAGGKGDAPQGAPQGRALPTWHAVLVYVLSPLIPALLALLYLGTARPDSVMRWNLTQMTLGVFRVSLAEGMLDPESWGQPDLVYYRDGLSTTVSVERWGRHYALKNNGKVDASNGDDMPTQITVAAYPLLMHPRGPQDLDVAIIGFGSGVSVGTALSFPVRSVDVIELERAILEASRYFQDVNLLEYTREDFPYVHMDRLEVIHDDGRNYLASTDRQYDIIISEPSNPWITGVSDLFTVDHFRITKRRLRPGGIYCQWVQLYELSPENIKTIYRTFASQFQHVVVFAADDRSSDTVMLGSDEPLTLDAERMWRIWEATPVAGRMSVRDQLERAYLHSPFDVFARVLLANRDEVMQYTQIERRRRGGEWQVDFASTNTGRCEPPDCIREAVRLNTDDNALIEFAAPRDLIGFERYEGYLATIYSPNWPYGRLEENVQGMGEGDTRAHNLAALALSLIAAGRYDAAATFIERSQQAGRARETAVALEVLTHLLSSEHEPALRIEPPIPGPEMDRRTSEQLVRGFDRVREAVDRRQWGAALSAMEDIPAPLRLHSGPSMRFLYGFLLYKAAEGSLAQYRAAAEQFDELVRADERYVQTHPEVYYYLARSREAEGEYGDAMRNMRLYVEARLSASPTEAVDIPEPTEATATDAAGESPKTEHDEGERT
jgi:spermidine synthase/MFS family permease